MWNKLWRPRWAEEGENAMSLMVVAVQGGCEFVRRPSGMILIVKKSGKSDPEVRYRTP